MTEETNHLVQLPKKLFHCDEVKRRIHEILHENLHDKQYDFDQCQSLAKHLSNLIKDALKTFDYERYKFIVQISISEENSENLHMICRSYWDTQTDRFAQSIYINQFLICVATAFAVFYY